MINLAKPALLVAGLAVVLTPMSALALGEGRGAGNRPSFETLDADGNGEVTKAEMQAAADARFASADTDGDGFLSVEELTAQASERMGARIEKMIERRDANDDGKLSRDELRPNEERMEKRFARIDADGNGAISKEEFEAMKDKRRAHRRNKAGE